MTEALKPCPFCGGTDLSSGGDDKVVGYWCNTCEATGPNHYGKHDWNRRADLPAAVTVKPLAWGISETVGMNLQSDCPFGRYYIALRADGNWLWWRPASSPAHQGCEKSEAQAKAAAQDDYERRVLSCLTSQPDLVKDAGRVPAAAVEALAAYQQADPDGVMVLVSRQAIDECMPALRALAEQEQSE